MFVYMYMCMYMFSICVYVYVYVRVYVYVYVYMYVVIYIYICMIITFIYIYIYRERERYLSNTTCLTHAFWHLPLCRFAIALVLSCDVSRFPFCRFSQHTISAITRSPRSYPQQLIGCNIARCVLCVMFSAYGITFVRGQHLSNTTCLTRVFFKSGESCGNSWGSLTRRSTRKTSEDVLDK